MVMVFGMGTNSKENVGLWCEVALETDVGSVRPYYFWEQ